MALARGCLNFFPLLRGDRFSWTNRCIPLQPAILRGQLVLLCFRSRCYFRNSLSNITFSASSYHQCTVKIALLLVTLPARLLTVTAKSAPLSATVVGGVV